jgi:predicted NBD/HSP70 family sugar kinase
MASRRAATLDDVRRHNRARLLRRLHEGGEASRSDLVAFTGLNRSTIGALVTELADVGLVSEVAGTAGQVGRPSLQVRPVPESAVVVAVELRVERSIALLVGLGGTVLARREQRHRRSDYGPGAAVRTVMSLMRHVLVRAPREASWVGVGVSVPGTVDHGDGRVRLAPNMGWTDVPLAALLQQAIEERYGSSPPVVVGNDADLGAVAEHVRGVGAMNRNLIYLSGEVGIGGGIIIDGVPMTGAGGYGGEVGHMVVNPTGTRCRCGAIGCWETEIGRDAVVSAAGLSLDAEVADIVAAAESGGRRVRSGMDTIGTWLGLGLVNLANLFNPEVIVLGGHLRLVYPLVQDVVEQQMLRTLPPIREQVRVELPALNGDSTLLGSAEAAFAALLTDPFDVLNKAQRDIA